MIIGVPTCDDFFDQGKELLVLSWTSVTRLLINFEHAKMYVDEYDFDEHEYWDKSIRNLSLALSTIQQGVDFILKGIICNISPFLIISSDHSKWPKEDSAGNIYFSDFKTIDSHDLPNVCRKVSNFNFSEDFTRRYKELRQARNKIMHSIDKRIKPTAIEVLDLLLFMHNALLCEEPWSAIRSTCLLQEPSTLLGGDEFITNIISQEFEAAINALPNCKTKLYFNVDKKMTAYYCPSCYDSANKDGGFEHKLARLTMKTLTCRTLYCPICNHDHEIERKTCSSCHGQVISKEGLCLSCQHWLD